MKKLLLTIIVGLSLCSLSYAQVPDSFRTTVKFVEAGLDEDGSPLYEMITIDDPTDAVPVAACIADPYCMAGVITVVTVLTLASCTIADAEKNVTVYQVGAGDGVCLTAVEGA